MNPDLPPALQQALTQAVAIQPTEVQQHVVEAAQRIQSGLVPSGNNTPPWMNRGALAE
jgi:hypothetical protein